jgi:hypothetical protein
VTSLMVELEANTSTTITDIIIIIIIIIIITTTTIIIIIIIITDITTIIIIIIIIIIITTIIMRWQPCLHHILESLDDLGHHHVEVEGLDVEVVRQRPPPVVLLLDRRVRLLTGLLHLCHHTTHIHLICEITICKHPVLHSPDHGSQPYQRHGRSSCSSCPHPSHLSISTTIMIILSLSFPPLLSSPPTCFRRASYLAARLLGVHDIVDNRSLP